MYFTHQIGWHSELTWNRRKRQLMSNQLIHHIGWFFWFFIWLPTISILVTSLRTWLSKDSIIIIYNKHNYSFYTVEMKMTNRPITNTSQSCPSQLYLSHPRYKSHVFYHGYWLNHIWVLMVSHIHQTQEYHIIILVNILLRNRHLVGQIPQAIFTTRSNAYEKMFPRIAQEN